MDNNKLKYKEYLKKKYEKERLITIECNFCNTITNIWSINNHLNKSKKCKKLKEIKLKSDPNIDDKITIKINELKKSIKYDDN